MKRSFCGKIDIFRMHLLFKFAFILILLLLTIKSQPYFLFTLCYLILLPTARILRALSRNARTECPSLILVGKFHIQNRVEIFCLKNNNYSLKKLKLNSVFIFIIYPFLVLVLVWKCSSKMPSCFR